MEEPESAPPATAYSKIPVRAFTGIASASGSSARGHALRQSCIITSAFDDFSWQPYDKVWRISVLRVVVSFLFRIPILWINARGIWYLVAVR